jgi:predicted transcriptional regulator
MQAEELPEDLQSLVRDHIESYEQLELLLLLRAERGVAWTGEALSARLRISSTLVSEALAKLQSGGFVVASTAEAPGGPTHAYRVQADDLEATIERLSQAYKEQPMPIIKLMCANSIERVRTAALRTFADAFILRKDKDRG